ncbi:hypothetical protein D7V86_23850 [bacterium D16-51]|nr:hypothetical protein D7V96_22185 [bacterium D16-59]RKI54319.1 hypothetical protein D7V86_23850 [bacterium D16-51]
MGKEEEDVGQQDFLEEETVDFLMEICKNEGDRFQCFFVYAEGRREKNIICHQQKLVLHEQFRLEST